MLPTSQTPKSDPSVKFCPSTTPSPTATVDIKIGPGRNWSNKLRLVNGRTKNALVMIGIIDATTVSIMFDR